MVSPRQRSSSNPWSLSRRAAGTLCIQDGAARQQQHDPSQEWQVVKSKRRTRPAGLPSLAEHSKWRGQRPLAPTAAEPTPEYKKWFQGRCFRCLAKDHVVAHCREPPRYLNCFGSGHLAHRCKAPPDRRRPPFLHPGQAQPKPPIRSHQTPSTAASPSQTSLRCGGCLTASLAHGWAPLGVTGSGSRHGHHWSCHVF
jgi:hypothetical protein